MNSRIKDVSQAVLIMEQYLHDNVQENKLWEKSFIKRQIEKRNAGGTFDLSDHIRAMVYSMLSAEKGWYLVQPHIESGEIDIIFGGFHPEELLKRGSNDLIKQIQGRPFCSRFTKRQMAALIDFNINKLKEIKEQHESIDCFYQNMCELDETYKMLIGTLSRTGSPHKLRQMGEPLVAEYLKNVGYDICKPDRHICRMLGCDILGCSDKEVVPVYEAIDIISDIASELGKSKAEVDYILWSYCAKGYGEICTVDSRNCSKCVVKKYCLKEKEN